MTADRAEAPRARAGALPAAAKPGLMDATEELPTAPLRSGARSAAAGGGDGGDPRLVLGRYRLGARLGSGGFGTVYEAQDERLGRAVAVKVIPAHGPAPERASREALAAARLDHPGIVGVFDAGQDDAARYLVSELVRGRTLDRLAAAGELSDRDVLRAGLSLADALSHAHERGVIHRDVKPQNVIVPDRPRSGRGAAKLTDFGVAHLAGDEPLTRTGDVVGTLAYMAPEQAAGQRVDERADLYALALVLFEGLAGVNPVRAASPAATARRVGTVLPGLQRSRRDLPPELCTALDRALRPRPDERGTLEDLGDALAAALPQVSDAGGTIAAHPLERAGPAALPPLVARIAAAAAAGGLAAAGVTLVPGAPVMPAAAGGAAALAVVLLPRAGWLACAAALLVLLVPDRPGAALLIAAAAAVPPLLAHRGGLGWSLPAAAPALGLAGLAGAYPALAGRARSVLGRAALGAAGAWWLLLAEPLLGRVLMYGPEPVPGEAMPTDAGRAIDGVLEPLATSGVLILAAIWALGAVVLPWLVRGRSLAADVIVASAWAAGLAAAAEAAGEWAQRAPPHGLAAGAVVAGVLAVALPRVLPRDTVEP